MQSTAKEQFLEREVDYLQEALSDTQQRERALRVNDHQGLANVVEHER